MKLLIVDDNRDITRVLSSIVRFFGHDVDEAGDGHEAIEQLQKNQYEVVITDAHMPRIDGIELCKYLKLQFPSVYIIGMSANASSLIELEEAGADICIPKPFGMNKLEKAIESRFYSSRNQSASLRSVAQAGKAWIQEKNLT